MTLKSKPNRPKWKRPEELRAKIARQVRSNVKVLFTVFSYCNGVACHKAVWSIRDTTLKLSADCAMQFVGKAQNCGKINRGSYTMITYQLTHRCLCVSFWPKTKTLNMPQTPYLRDLAPTNIFIFPK